MPLHNYPCSSRFEKKRKKLFHIVSGWELKPALLKQIPVQCRPQHHKVQFIANDSIHIDHF